MKTTWSPTQLSLLLQFMHRVGVFVGICFRTNTGCFLHLPHMHIFLSVLSHTRTHGHTHSHTQSVAVHTQYPVTTTVALAMRFGICSVYPEPVLDMYTHAEMASMLCMGSMHTRLAHLMYKFAKYEDPLTAADYHIQVCILTYTFYPCKKHTHVTYTYTFPYPYSTMHICIHLTYTYTCSFHYPYIPIPISIPFYNV